MKARSVFLLLAVLMLALPSANHASEYRNWTSRMGASVHARFDRVSGRNIILQKTDGAFVKIDYAILSGADQLHLRSIARPRQNTTHAAQTRARQRWLSNAPRLAAPPKQGNNEDNQGQHALVQQQNPWAQNQNRRVLQEHNEEVLEQNMVLQQPDQWWQDKNRGLQQGNIQNQADQNFANRVHGEDHANHLADNPQHEKEPLSDWKEQQADQDRWMRQQEQARLKRDKENLESDAWRLEHRIRSAQHDSRPDYSGLSSQASMLSQDADRLGEHDASWQFGRAASSLREAERQQDSFHNQYSDFNSREDEERQEAQRDVWGGRGSINTFETGNSIHGGSSFGSGSSMDSW